MEFGFNFVSCVSLFPFLCLKNPGILFDLDFRCGSSDEFAFRKIRVSMFHVLSCF